MLEARHQVFNGLNPAPFIEDLSLGLNDALLGGLALPANVIYLLLQGVAVGNLTVQRGLKCLGLTLQCRTLGLGSRDLLAQRAVGIAGRLQLSSQGLDDRLQRGNSGRDGFGGRSTISLGINGLTPSADLSRTSSEQLGRYTNFCFAIWAGRRPMPRIDHDWSVAVSLPVLV